MAVSGSMKGQCIEYVDHLHDHFVDPVAVRDGAYRAPSEGGRTRVRAVQVSADRHPGTVG